MQNSVVNAVTDAMRKNEDIEKKKNNLVIFNVPETNDGSIEERKENEKEKMKKLPEVLETDTEICELRRIGKMQPNHPRPLMVKFIDFSSKMLMLRSAKKLAKVPRDSNFARVFMQLDRTKLQQAENKKLVIELQRRRNNGEKVGLRADKIINFDQPQSDSTD